MMFFLQSCVYSLNIMIYFREKFNQETIRKILSIILIPIGIIRYIFVSVKSYFNYDVPNKCAIVMIVKNEGPYLKEYIEYYSALDCDLIIYDNDSTDLTNSIVKEYKNVLYIKWSGKKRQNDAYNHACKNFKKSYKYLMFFDADEYLVADDLLKGKPLIEILNDFFSQNNRIASLGINWLIFGSSGFVDDPKDGVIDSFVNCSTDDFEWNQLVKSCVIPSRIIGWVNPHLPLQTFGFYRVDLDYKKISSPRIKLPQNRSIRLFHYFVKSKNHFQEKVEKGMADRLAKRSLDEFYYYDRNDTVNIKAKLIKKMLGDKKEKNEKN